MYEYQRNRQYFAQIADEIKELGARELSELGAANIRPAYGGLYFSAGREVMSREHYSARLASRILAPLASFQCLTSDQLYKKAKETDWRDFISEGNTFAIVSNVSNSRITNSHYASLRLKDGIADSFRGISGKRPDVDTKNPQILLNLHIGNDRAVISLDT